MKHAISRPAVERIAERLARGRGRFDSGAFVSDALRGLGRLELKDRVRQVAAALREHLYPDYQRALAQIVDTLGPPLPDTERVTQGWDYWPLCQFVESYGLEHTDLSLAAIYELTQRFSCEFAIRPYLEREPARALKNIRRWLRDPSPHVRRLCSEGTRPRLPWGAHLKRFQENPRETRFVLDRLVDDPEAYVRRSVANHLNDHCKNQPGFALEVAESWASKPSQNRRQVIRHGLRTLIKKGDQRALALLGFRDADFDLKRFRITPASARAGDQVTLSLELRSRSRRVQRLLIDYVLHYRRADGSLGPKVFKWTERPLAAGEQVSLSKRHRFHDGSSRRHHPGEHAFELQVNGRSLGRRKVRLIC